MMPQLFIERMNRVNLELLDEELSVVTGYEACSGHPTGVTIYFSGTVDLNNLRAIVAAHDETALSAKAIQLAALKTEITTLKSAVGNIDDLTTTETTAAIKLLYKVLRVNRLI